MIYSLLFMLLLFLLANFHKSLFMMYVQEYDTNYYFREVNNNKKFNGGP